MQLSAAVRVVQRHFFHVCFMSRTFATYHTADSVPASPCGAVPRDIALFVCVSKPGPASGGGMAGLLASSSVPSAAAAHNAPSATCPAAASSVATAQSSCNSARAIVINSPKCFHPNAWHNTAGVAEGWHHGLIPSMHSQHHGCFFASHDLCVLMDTSTVQCQHALGASHLRRD